MTVATIAQVLFLLWLDPDWLDRVAFWRPKPFDREVLFSTDPTQARLLAEQDAAAARRPDRLSVPRLLESASVQAAYDPTQGATLVTHEGSRVFIPPGAISERTTVKITPVIWMPEQLMDQNLRVVGPGYQVFVGDQAHYDFARPVEVEIPYVPEWVEQENIQNVAVFLGRDGRWSQCPSQVDVQSGRVRAQVSRCSWWFVFQWGVRGLVFGSLSSAVAYNLSATVRGVYHRFSGTLDKVYETAHFKIYYTESGTDAVHPDGGTAGRPAFPLAPGKPVPPHPTFVVLTGELLENCLPGLDKENMSIPSSWTSHYAFITNLANEYGLSPPGGPVWLTSQWTEGAGFPKGLDANFRGTIAHELIHVAQGRFFSNYQGRQNKWYFETTASFLADRFWDARGSPTDLIFREHMRDDDGRMLTHPINIDHSEINYSYASFLNWLRAKDDVVAMISQVNSGGTASVDAVDAVLRERVKQSLGGLLREFAQDYYHDQLWHGKTMPFGVFDGSVEKQAERQSYASKSFTFVARAPSGGNSSGAFGDVSFYDFAVIGSMPLLTSRAYIVEMSVVPKTRKGKLVVQYETQGSSSDFALSYAASSLMNSLPAGGTRGGFAAFPISGDEASRTMIEGIYGGGGIDRVTVIASNLSASEAVNGGTLSRWLLIAPAFVSSFREAGTNRWHVGWEKSELAEHPQVFGGYDVYRRKVGESEESWVRVVERHDKDFYEETAPDAEDYVYTASVVDKYDNESEKAEVSDEDPFQGLWRGKVVLEQGRIAEPVMKWLAKWLGGEKDGRSSQFLEKARKVLLLVEKILKAGIPVDLRITREEGKYYSLLERLFWKKVDPQEQEKKELERVGALSLMARGEPGEEPALIQLHRPDEIRTTVRQEPKRGSGGETLVWRIELHRIEEPGS